MIRLRDLDTRPNPLDDAVVFVIKGFFDNSGDAEDPQHKVLTVGGFLANEDQWARFEDKWQANLDRYGLPYLRMKEFAHFLGPFHIFKGRAEDRALFLQGCILAIRDFGITQSICNAIRVHDVRRFNDEYERKIDPFAFCLYIAHIDIQSRFHRDEHIELVVDPFPRVTKKVLLAGEYSRRDTFHSGPASNIVTLALSADLSFRSTLQIQAADFLVWELRKSQDRYDEWFEVRKSGPVDGTWIPELHEWAFRKFGVFPSERRSLRELYAVCNNENGIVVSYRTLISAERYHPNGWGDV
jgi:hypothetical protein